MASPLPRREAFQRSGGAAKWLQGLSPCAQGRLSACGSRAEAVEVLEEA